MKAENQKFTMQAMMDFELRSVCRAVSHSRGTGTTHASQQIRAKVAAQPLPSYIPKADNRGQNNTGRVWRF
jgi:hypothetical protein